MLWDTTDGVVVGRDTWTHRVGGMGRTPGGTKYYLRVVYEYVVDGRQYHGWRVNHGYSEWHDDHGNPCHSFGFGGDRDEAAAGYRRGKRVEVHYDSGDPADSVLQVGLTRYQWIALFAGPIFFFMGRYLFRSLKSNEAWAEHEERRRGPDISVD